MGGHDDHAGRHPKWPTERRQPAVLDIPYLKACLSPGGVSSC